MEQKRLARKYQLKCNINERIHNFSTGETCALVIKTLRLRKQNAEPQGKCQPFSLELASIEIFVARNFGQKPRRIFFYEVAGAHCKSKYKGQHHETAR